MGKESNQLKRYQQWAKKRQKGLSPFSYLNPDGGNVPLGIAFFNSSVAKPSADSDSSVSTDVGGADAGASAGVGESIDFNKAERTFKLFDAQQKIKNASTVSKAESELSRADSKLKGENMSENINEMKDNVIELEYDDIDVKGYYGPTDWETGYTKEYEETVDWVLYVDKSEIEEDIANILLEKRPELTDAQIDEVLENDFDELFNEYYDKILEIHRKEAEEDANEKYEYDEYEYDDYYDESYSLNEAGKHIEDIAQYKMDALTREIDDLNQSLNDIVDSPYLDYRKRDSLANRLNGAQDDLRRLQQDFGYILDKPANESLEGGKMTLREAINQIDYATDCAYDLINLYESIDKSKKLDYKLISLVKSGAKVKELYEALYEAYCDKCKSYDKELDEDTVKRNGKWVNVGKDGKADSGKFRTKKEADAQRRAMYANGRKGESLKESEDLKEYNINPIKYGKGYKYRKFLVNNLDSNWRIAIPDGSDYAVDLGWREYSDNYSKFGDDYSEEELKKIIDDYYDWFESNKARLYDKVKEILSRYY